jgi:hypothetical protein
MRGRNLSVRSTSLRGRPRWAADSRARAAPKNGVTKQTRVTSIPWARSTAAASMLSSPPEKSPRARMVLVMVNAASISFECTHSWAMGPSANHADSVGAGRRAFRHLAATGVLGTQKRTFSMGTYLSLFQTNRKSEKHSSISSSKPILK